MIRIICLLLCCWMFWIYAPTSASAKTKTTTPPSIIACYSGGREILRSEIVSGPFADEYKFANTNNLKEYLVFGGGACIGKETDFNK